MDKAAITHILEWLGPERVERGLPAFAQTRFADIWSECFLGRAVGIAAGESPGTVARTLFPLGATYTKVTGAFDHERDALHALVLEWLEANRAPTPSAPLEVAHVPVHRVPQPV